MKKLMRTFALMAVAALGLSACTGEKLVPDNGNADGKFVTVHFGAEAAIEGATKATLTPNEAETMFASAWEKDKDAICVSYKNGNTTQTTATGTWNGTTFLANLPSYTGKWEYQACYPNYEDTEVPFGSERKQKGNLYNSDYDIMVASKVNVDNGAAGKDDKGNDIVFQMDRQTGIVYFHLTSSLEEEVVSAKLSVEGGNIASSYALLGPSGFSAEPDLKEITITFTEAPTAKDIRLWFNVLPTSYTSMSLVVETTGHTLTLTNNVSGEFVAGKLYKSSLSPKEDKWIANVPTIETVSLTKDQFVKLGKVSYSDSEKTITNDNGFIWALRGMKDATRPWFQIRKDVGSYIKIAAPKPIREVRLIITSTINSKGRIEDISKHTSFSGEIHLKTEDTIGNGDEKDVVKTSLVEKNTTSLVPNGSNSILYIKVSSPARIWGIDVDY